MALTDENLLKQADDNLGGVQRVYRLGDYGLSLINAPMLHAYPFAWEAAVIKFDRPHGHFSLTYETPLTSDVEVFDTEEEAISFIERAFTWFREQSASQAA